MLSNNTDSRSIEDFNESFVMAWKTTHNYKQLQCESNDALNSIPVGYVLTNVCEINQDMSQQTGSCHGVLSLSVLLSSRLNECIIFTDISNIIFAFDIVWLVMSFCI